MSGHRKGDSEFTQFGCEWLGIDDVEQGDAFAVAKNMLNLFAPNLPFEFHSGVKRGLSYYTKPGFEITAPWLGAQKQVAGGGAYNEGVGFAIGIDRLVLAIMEKSNED